MVPWCSLTTWKFPATTAVMYVDIFGVRANCHHPPVAGLGTWVAGLFDETCQPAGARTENSKVLFRSGWSKQG